MKNPKSNAEIQVIQAINHMEVMMSKRVVRTEDARYLINTSYKVLQKCEELRKSRDLAISRRNEAQEELKRLIKSL